MALDPPLLLITHDKILHEELASLPEENDYNLSTMVASKLHVIYKILLNYLSVHLLSL